MRILLTFISSFLLSYFFSFANNVTLRGFVTNPEFKPLVGASVYVENSFIGTITDQQGFYELKNIPRKSLTIVVTMVGMKPKKDTLDLTKTSQNVIDLDFILEENPIQFGSIVVTSSKSEKIYDEVPIKVSTMDSKHFEITNVQNLREALLYQPGVRTEVNCQNCGFSQVRINGMEGKYSQILFDGKPLFSSLNGVYGLEQIPVNMIERIEVVRGGGSTLYGGNAVAGVINIITKEPLFNSYSLSIDNVLIPKNSNERNLNMFGTIVNESKQFGLTVFGSIQNRSGYDANGDGFTEIGRLNLKMFGLKNQLRIEANHKFELEFHSISHSIRGGNKLDEPPHLADICEMAEHDTYLAQISYDYSSFSFSKFKFSLGAQSTKRNTYYGANKDINAYGDTKNYTIFLNFHYNSLLEFLGIHSFLFGYDFNKDFMEDRAPAYDRLIIQNVFSNGFYFQDDWTLGDNLSILWGFRLDKHNLIHNLIFNPRSSLMWRVKDELTLRATYSTGYRAPQAFDEDLHITQVGGEGLIILLAKDLKPEYSNSFSLSSDFSLLKYQIPLALSLEVFYTKLNNSFTLVDLGSTADKARILQRQNSSGSFVRGATFEIQSSLTENYYFKLGLTIQDSRYLEKVEWSSGDEIKGLPPQYSDKIFKSPSIYGFLLFSYSFNSHFNLDINGNFIGPMFIPHYAGYIEQDQLVSTPSFFDLSLKFNFKIFLIPELKFTFGINNVLNHYQNDFDIGINRDANYMYGPFRPRNFFVKFDLSI